MDIAREVFEKKRVIMGDLAKAGFVLSSDGTADDHGALNRAADDHGALNRAADDHGASNGSAADGSDAFNGAHVSNCYIYTEQFMDGDLTAVIKIMPDGRVVNSVIDADSGDEYYPMNIEAHTGSYVGQAREEYKALLERVAGKCFDDVPFVCDQANRIASKISARFGVEPEFPFHERGSASKSLQPSTDSAVFRHKDNGRWFAIVMTIKREKLEKYSGAGDEARSSTIPDERMNPDHSSADPDDRINVMNVKIYPEELEALLREPGLYRCYHMNKKQWITIALDDECTDDRIMELLECSFRLTCGGTSVRKRRGSSIYGSQGNGEEYYEESGDRRYWLIPSNPANFDVAKGFRDSGNDTLAWHHRIDVMPGDIVYIYQTEPIASIMWECEVLESYMPRPADWGSFAPNSKYRMTLKRLRSFNKGDYPRSWMNEHGIKKTVRGQRSAPDELVKAMSEGSAE